MVFSPSQILYSGIRRVARLQSKPSRYVYYVGRFSTRLILKKAQYLLTLLSLFGWLGGKKLTLRLPGGVRRSLESGSASSTPSKNCQSSYSSPSCIVLVWVAMRMVLIMMTMRIIVMRITL